MDSKSAFDFNPLVLVLVGLALGLSLAAIALSLVRVRSVVRERRPRWPQAKWIVVPVFGCALLGIAMVWLLYTPLYCATAVLRISPSSPTIVFPGAKQETPQYQVFVNTEVSVMAGPTVLERVLDRADVKETQWYKDTILQTTQTGRGGLAEKFEEALGVEPRRGTELIDISISAPKPADARLMADAVLTEYKKLRGDLDKQRDTQVSEILTSEQATLLMEIDGLIKTRFTISGRLGTDTPEQLRSMLSQHMIQIEDQIHEKQRQQEMLKWELDYLRISTSRPTSGPGEGSANSSLALKTMDLSRLARELELLQKDLERQKVRVGEAGDIALEIASFDERLRQKRELYEAVRLRREQLDMEKKAPAPVRIVAYASEPIHPWDDRRPGTTLGILAAAACLSLLLLAVRPSDGTRTSVPRDDEPFMEHPSGEFKSAAEAMTPPQVKMTSMHWFWRATVRGEAREVLRSINRMI